MSELRVPNRTNGRESFVTPPDGFLRIGNYNGGHVHNNSEVTLTQTDNDLLARSDGFWVVSGEFVAKGYSDFLARTNISNDQIDRWLKDSLCAIEESVLYVEDTVDNFTEAENGLGVRWSGNQDCGAGHA